jgi:hypothetical protein
VTAAALDFRIGRRYRYPGDQANAGGEGTIVLLAADASGRGGRMTGILDDGRRQTVPLSLFTGLRPWVLLDAVASDIECTRAVNRAREREARLATEKALAQVRFTADVERLVAQYPAMKRPGPDLYAPKAAAMNLRALLRAAGVTASVRMERGSGSSIRVELPAGATDDAVHLAQEIAGQFKEGSFDGMTDCYEYQRTPWTQAFGGVQYVFVSRAWR